MKGKYSGRYYVYKPLIQWTKKYVLFISLMIFFVILPLAVINVVAKPELPLTDRILVIPILLLLLLTCLYYVYSWPEIVIDEKGIWVEFLWKPLRVNWEDIEDVIEIKSLFKLFRIWAVKTKKLTPFHQLYGLLNVPINSQCFIIHSSINNHLELIQTMKKWSHHKKASMSI